MSMVERHMRRKPLRRADVKGYRPVISHVEFDFMYDYDTVFVEFSTHKVVSHGTGKWYQQQYHIQVNVERFVVEDFLMEEQVSLKKLSNDTKYKCIDAVNEALEKEFQEYFGGLHFTVTINEFKNV